MTKYSTDSVREIGPGKRSCRFRECNFQLSPLSFPTLRPSFSTLRCSTRQFVIRIGLCICNGSDVAICFLLLPGLNKFVCRSEKFETEVEAGTLQCSIGRQAHTDERCAFFGSEEQVQQVWQIIITDKEGKLGERGLCSDLRVLGLRDKMESFTESEVAGFGVGALLLAASLAAPKVDFFFAKYQRRSMKLCEKCGGVTKLPCKKCRGRGQQKVLVALPWVSRAAPSCDACRGTGQVSCPSCSTA